MITGLLIHFFSDAAALLIGLLPSWQAPSWLTDAVTTLASAVADITLLGGWVPIKAIGTVVAFLLAISAVAISIKVGRIVLSLFTGGGGSAA